MLFKVRVKDPHTGKIQGLEVEAASKYEAHRLAREDGREAAQLEEAKAELAQWEATTAARQAEETRRLEKARQAEEDRRAEPGRQAAETRRAEAARRIAAVQLAEAARSAEARKAEAARQVAGAASHEVAANVLRYAEIVNIFGVITIALSVLGGVIFVASFVESAKGEAEATKVIYGLALVMGGLVCGVGYLTAAAVLRLLVGLKADTRQLCDQVARLEQHRPGSEA